MEPNVIVMGKAEVMMQAKARRLSRGMLLLATGLLLAVVGDRTAVTQVSPGIAPLEILNLQVKPNVIVVLDSSGSMGENLMSPIVNVTGDYERSKLALAKKVLNQVVIDNADKVNFLSAQYAQGDTTMLNLGPGANRFIYSANSYDYPSMLDVEVSMSREPGTDSQAAVTAGVNDRIRAIELACDFSSTLRRGCPDGYEIYCYW